MSHCSCLIVNAALLCFWFAACESTDSGITTPPPPTARLSAATTLGDPFANLSAAQLALVDAGKVEFEAVEAIDEGLGPVFNEASCATCHNGPVGGTTGRMETRFGRVVNGGFDPLTELGGSLIQDKGIGLVTTAAGSFTFVGEVVPTGATVTARRITTPLFGLGLVDAVPDEQLVQLARLEAATSPATAGTLTLTTDIRTGRTRVGRFGWKAQVPTLFQFSGDAYLNEMGITTPDFPNENCPQGDCSELSFNPAPGINDDGSGPVLLTNFMTLLAAPPRAAQNGNTSDGEASFDRVGCTACHVATLHTGSNAVSALDHKTYHPYSD